MKMIALAALCLLPIVDGIAANGAYSRAAAQQAGHALAAANNWGGDVWAKMGLAF